MRIALLSALDSATTPASVRPAFAQFAGAMVIERQLDLAIRLGCERVACLVDTIESEIVELQHRAEKAGLKFRALRQPSRIGSMVEAEDELLVMAPGVLPDDDAVEASLGKGQVLVLPADIAVPLGYERIDLELAWSGVMLVPGKVIDRLGQLPDDVDVPSALMRIALQSGSQMAALDRELVAEGKWQLNADRQALDLREKKWIDAQREQISFRAPGLAVAERAGARLARDVVGRSAQSVATIAAGVSLLGAAVAGALGFAATGLALVSFGALFGHMGGVVERVARLGRPKRGIEPIQKVLSYLVDPLLIALLILAAPESLEFLRVFVPLMLIGLLRLGERHASDKWRRTYSDRIMLGFLLAPAAFIGYSTELAALFALVVLATRFFQPFRAD
ncbi:hypothetical protein [Qipengyuania sphaerica]|uniref:hypothetical protein n=1 Tax=Qipengyuania sphaerica TaxID=2867243 RepID=UPI001C86958B|nr:hypothetical protein [Qipengyuania sphaerica]MBX7540605.1 hypothetical protein [Qipengyuania sphaerica]